MKIKSIEKWINAVYLPYVECDTRELILYGGAGSGKSVFAVQRAILKALGERNRKVLVVRKVGATLKDSIWNLLLEMLSPFRMCVAGTNISDLTITLKNGSKFIFKGLDDREKIKSINGIDDIIIEEASELSYDDYTQLKLRLRSKKPNNQITMMFNPVSKANWTYKRFFEGKVPPNCTIVNTTYRDNPHLTPEYIEELERLKETNPPYYRIYALGEFATLDKLVFPIYQKRLISDAEVAGLRFWIGMDFGYVNDPTAINWGRYDAEKKIIYICGEFDKKGMTNDEIAKTIADLGFSKERIVADSAEQKSIEEIKRMGIRHIMPCVKGGGSVLNGLDKMLRCAIIIDERCTKTIEEFNNYTWRKDKQSGEYINEPIDAFNHHIDACRYGLQPCIDKKTNTGGDIDPRFI